MEAKFGQVKVVMYPKAAGNGIVANDMITEVCKMAGIHDIGVKVHGARNPRNTGEACGQGFARS
jgi:ribosomal protein S5